jgi:magnesium chelatase subunit D
MSNMQPRQKEIVGMKPHEQSGSSLYPFAALVGLEDLQLALLLSCVNPAIGGLLIRGEKGTAKSTAVRGLAELLSDIEVISGCVFACDPEKPRQWCADCRRRQQPVTELRKVRLINLPLNVSEDRLAGGIDFSAAVKSGKTVFLPGLMAEAHRGIIYIDEVNLLDDHIVDLILDTAASGWNVVEREGISIRHAASFTLIGTMNPEEGELRPQFLDRFGLCIEVQGCADLEQRVELLKKRDEFDRNPASFCQRFADRSEQIRFRIKAAQKKLPTVRLPPAIRTFITELCLAKNVAGHRADLVLEQAAITTAALAGDNEVTMAHIQQVASMVLLHRQRESQPPPPPEPPQNSEEGDNQGEETSADRQDHSEDQGVGQEPTEEQHESAAEQQEPHTDSGQPQDVEPDEQEDSPKEDNQHLGSKEKNQDQLFEISAPFTIKKISTPKDRLARLGSGRRSRSRVALKQGRYSRAARHGIPGDIALDATIRAAAPFQVHRKGNLALNLIPDDFRYKIREKRIGNLLLFLVDASGSMGAKGRMAASKGAVMSLLLDAYQKRDKVAMISFRGQEAVVNLPVTGSVEMAGKLLAEMRVGGRTPLAAGLVGTYEQLRNYLIREPAGRPIVIIITDGKANVSLGETKPVDEMLKIASTMATEQRAKYIVVDTEEEGPLTFGLAGKMAKALQADFFKITDLKARDLVHIVREKQ